MTPMEDWTRSRTHTRRVFEAAWLGNPFLPWTWRRGWAVVYTRVRQGHGRIVARFRGPFANRRAIARAERLHHAWVRDHIPTPIRVPIPSSSSISKPLTSAS